MFVSGRQRQRALEELRQNMTTLEDSNRDLVRQARKNKLDLEEKDVEISTRNKIRIDITVWKGGEVLFEIFRTYFVSFQTAPVSLFEFFFMIRKKIDL